MGRRVFGIGDGGRIGLGGAEDRVESLQGNSMSISGYGFGGVLGGLLGVQKSELCASISLAWEIPGNAGCMASLCSMEDIPSSAAVTPTESLELENPYGVIGCQIAPFFFVSLISLVRIRKARLEDPWSACAPAPS